MGRVRRCHGDALRTAALVLLATCGCGSRTGLETPAPAPDAAIASPFGTRNPASCEVDRPRRLLAAGSVHTCAIGTDEATYCWGASFEEVFSPTVLNESILTPERVDELDAPVRWLAAGRWHTCAVTERDEVWCWDAYGVFAWDGDEVDVADAVVGSDAPDRLEGFGSDIAEVEASFATTCARSCDGSVACFGNNAAGNLGDGTHDSRIEPRVVVGLGPVADLALSSNSSCALERSGQILCWGDQMDSPTEYSPYEDDDLLLPTPLRVQLHNVVSLEAGSTSFGQLCALQDGRALCWGVWDTPRDPLGGPRRDGLERPLELGLRGVVEVSLSVGVFHSGSHHCALHTSGRVSCWGDNRLGQLGDGTRISRDVPMEVPGLDDVVDIVVGGAHACARRRSGELLCWGGNTHGQLGDGTTEDRDRPTRVLLP